MKYNSREVVLKRATAHNYELPTSNFGKNQLNPLILELFIIIVFAIKLKNHATGIGKELSNNCKTLV